MFGGESLEINGFSVFQKFTFYSDPVLNIVKPFHEAFTFARHSLHSVTKHFDFHIKVRRHIREDE